MRKENAGKLGALEIKAMCKIMQILCLTERKKKSQKSVSIVKLLVMSLFSKPLDLPVISLYPSFKYPVI